MEQARSARVWAAVNACAQREGAPVSLRHVVVACVDALTAGACLSLARGFAPHEPVLASIPAAEAVEELQSPSGRDRAWTSLPGAAWG